jgi:thymidylate kinase
LFAVDMLDGDDLATFKRTYTDLYAEPRPDIVVYLRVAPQLCLERVRLRMQRDRRRAFEAGMSLGRLQRMRVLYEANLDRLGREVVSVEVSASMDEASVADVIVEVLRARIPALAR